MKLLCQHMPTHDDHNNSQVQIRELGSSLESGEDMLQYMP